MKAYFWESNNLNELCDNHISGHFYNYFVVLGLNSNILIEETLFKFFQNIGQHVECYLLYVGSVWPLSESLT